MNRIITSMLWIWAFCFFLTTPAAASGTKGKIDDGQTKKASVELKFNLKPGEKYLFSSVVKQEIVQEAMGQQITTTQDISTEYIYAIKAQENGITEIDVTMSAIKMDTDVGGMQRITFDSSDPDAGTSELKVMSNVVGKTFQLYINEDGSIHKVEGFADVFGAMGGQQAEILEQSFGDSSLVQSMNQITNIYPDTEVSIGDTWVKTFSGPIANLMQSETTSNFTLSELAGDIAVLEVAGQLTFSKFTGEGGNPMLQAADFNMSGTQHGTMEIDVNSGLPLLSKLKQDITGSMDMQGMKIPMSIASSITITGKKL
ncbi:DUF6263 family protein [Parapedobacter sp. 10938]|uniref:DUF6263 family protein n=1 Tax=Parapedobacter flavus TaxID=3110225 RepID=UPI002DBD2E5F|nr:DUF6263 family protein [Parapedobacter sp. 10938]MEC3880420.1 DUF6263 family protein [Parapedobacter sp. 10938]